MVYVDEYKHPKDSHPVQTNIIPEGRNIIQFGEYGDSFYVILSGRVSVQVPTDVEEQLYTLQQLTEFLFENHNILVKDEEYDIALTALRTYFPEAVKTSEKGKITLNYNFVKLKLKALANSSRSPKMMRAHSFPHFGDQAKEAGSPKRGRNSQLSNIEEEERPFSFKILTKITELGEGASFGEVALLHKGPRTASIITETESTLAILEKKDFSAIMGRFYKTRLIKQMDLMDNFMLFKELKDSAKEKICILLKE